MSTRKWLRRPPAINKPNDRDPWEAKIPFNVHEFKANGLKLGGARPSLFEVNIFPPFATNAASRIRFLCKAASIPPMIVDDIPVFYFGRATSWAGDRQFPPWEITVLNDEDFAIRKVFENWNNRINALVSNRMDDSVFPTGYKVNGIVTQMGKAGGLLRSYEFEGLWPKVVDAMPLDWGAQNQIQEFNVTLAYDLWTPGDVATGQDDFTGVLADEGAQN